MLQFYLFCLSLIQFSVNMNSQSFSLTYWKPTFLSYAMHNRLNISYLMIKHVLGTWFNIFLYVKGTEKFSVFKFIVGFFFDITTLNTLANLCSTVGTIVNTNLLFYWKAIYILSSQFRMANWSWCFGIWSEIMTFQLL